MMGRGVAASKCTTKTNMKQNISLYFNVCFQAELSQEFDVLENIELAASSPWHYAKQLCCTSVWGNSDETTAPGMKFDSRQP